MQFAVAAHKLQLGEVEYYARKLQFGKLAAKKLLLWKTINSSGSDCMQVPNARSRRDSCCFDILAGLIGAALQLASGMGGMPHACLIPIILFLQYHLILIFDYSDIQIESSLFFLKKRGSKEVFHELSFVISY
jgi:hypothetical protein